MSMTRVQSPINVEKWIEENAEKFKPPVSILFDPLLYVNRRLHFGHSHERISTRVKRQTRSVEPSLTALPQRLKPGVF